MKEIIMKINTENAPELLIDVMKAKLVPFITSSPGLGKSSIIAEIANKNKLEVIDLRLAQCDPTDLNGFPSINEEKTKAKYVSMDYFPIEGDKLKPNTNGWLLLLDEFNSAPLTVQAAAYKIVLDRKIGQYNLHDRVMIICAGNTDIDNAIVNRLSTAMQSRLIHFEMEVNVKHWLKWASINNIDYRIMAWIHFKKDALHMFDPEHSDKTFPCPRTWEFLSKLIKNWIKIPTKKLPLICGTIGEGMGIEFNGYCDIFDKIPTIEEIIKNPEHFIFDEEPSIMYALTMSIANHINNNNINKLIKAIERFPIEFQMVCLTSSIQQKPELANNLYVDKWVETNAQDLM